MEPATAALHRILEYLLTKAIVSGKTKSASIKVPYKELVQDWDGAKYKDIDLIVEIKTKWANKDDETLPLEISEVSDEFTGDDS